MKLVSILRPANSSPVIISRYSSAIYRVTDELILSSINNLQDMGLQGEELQGKLSELMGIEIAYKTPKSKSIRPLTHLEMIITYSCNSKCEYCWQIDNNLPKNSRMNMDTFNRSIEVLQQYNKDNRLHVSSRYEIGYMGGEPLIMSNFIFESYDEACRKLQDKVIGKVISNGILLSEDICEELKRRSFIVTVSLDGPEEMNKRRGNFEKSWEGIENARKAAIQTRIQATLSLLQFTDKSVMKTVEFFLENNLINFEILLEAPLMVIPEEQLYEAYKDILIRLNLWAKKNGKVPWMIKDFIFSISGHTAGLNNCFCRFLYPVGLQVDPIGNAFACEFNRERVTYGNVNGNEFSLNGISDVLRDVTKYNDPICSQCSFIGICKGYPRLCSLYNKSTYCPRQSYYKASFDVLINDLEYLNKSMLQEVRNENSIG